MTSVAIIGAGMSGLAAAHTLQDAGRTVTLFEKSRGVGGRTATRKRNGFIYDHGAQYFKGGSDLSTEWITKRFPTSDLFDIAKPVWIFDGTGRIQEGDPKQNADPKWAYRSGFTSFAKRMAEGLDVRLEMLVGRIHQTDTGWAAFGADNEALGKFDQLLITIPATQAISLITASHFVAEQGKAICEQLGKAKYNPLISVMLGYKPTPQTRPYYALVNTDKGHPISWLAWEHEKTPQRAPEGTGLLIAQMAPQYSKEHRGTPQPLLFQDVAQLVSTLVEEQLTIPMFTDVQYWRYALPSEKADTDALLPITLPLGLAFCGDAFVGGRAHLALEDGVHVAQRLLQI
ncbi:MAG: FAD-dependent oxidoreductase [Ktedonobacteraceae bacterium]